MNRTQKSSVLLTVGILALSAAAAAASGPTLLDQPRIQDWMEAYGEVNGDRRVELRLEPSRFFLTERTGIRGSVRLDLIGGGVSIELSNLDRPVDVWALDNAAGSGILPGDAGDRLLHLARLSPGEGGGASFEAELGAEAFRGFELDWIYVSEAGMKPTESRLLFSTRNYFERLYTKRRLAREGFPQPLRSHRLETETLAGFGTKAGVASGTEAVAGFESKAGGVGIADEPHPILVTKGLVTQEQFDGADIFFRNTFDGNGRTCGTCHPAENNQTIDPPAFINSLPDTDPLFVAEQRAKINPNDPIAKLEVPALMRNHGLIVENVDGLEDPTVKFVMRGVPHSLSLATSTTGPGGIDDGLRTGWGGDGAPAPGTLRMFLLGAVIQHFPNKTLQRQEPDDFTLPSDEDLDLNLEFMLGVGRLNDIDLNGVSLNNPDAESGRVLFIPSGCNTCHFNAGANFRFSTDPPENRNFFTNVEDLFNPATLTDPDPLDRTDYPRDGGFGTVPQDCDGDGDIDADDGFGDCTFNSTPLIEAADTAPFFHNNTAETIEDAVAFYSGPEFPGNIFPDVGDQQKVAAFLRVLNASFNLQIAIQRNFAALVLTPGGPLPETQGPPQPDSNGVKATANKLLDLANDESEDAVGVLTDGPLGNLDATATKAIQNAIKLNSEAIQTSGNTKRRQLINDAIEELQAADASLGSGTGFTLGSANLLF